MGNEVDSLLNLTRDPEAKVRAASFGALARLRDPRAVPLAVAALTDREAPLAALECIRTLGSPAEMNAVVSFAKRNPAADVVPLTAGMLADWSRHPDVTSQNRAALEQAIAEVQGATGYLARWSVIGPFSSEAAGRLIPASSAAAQPLEPDGETARWQTRMASGTDGRVRSESAASSKSDATWLAATDITIEEPATVQFLGASNGTLRVWCNEHSLYDRAEARRLQPDSDRFESHLAKGASRILLQVSGSSQPAEFQLRFRQKSSNAERERLIQLALARAGNPDRGRAVFENMEKAPCLKCHRMGERGERIGPELTGIGGRFSRIAIIESILEPSRTIAPSFETVTLSLNDGRVLSGVRVDETETVLTLANQDGQKLAVTKADIESRKAQSVSTMPDGLEKPLTADEFVDLIAYLVGQK
jgi:putative heme-binding domain-containing protein